MTTGSTEATATDLWRMSALELAQVVRSGEASSREVIEAHLRRIEEVNPSINAVTVVFGEQALEAAKTADDAVAAGDDLPRIPRGALHRQGEHRPHRHADHPGAEGMAEAYPSRDAPVVEGARAAGAIPIGHTNCSTITVRWHTDSELWGATVNPWDRSRTPGASSGGEAAALATGMTPGAGQRWARIASLAGAMLRCQRPQADAGAHPPCQFHRAR